MRIRVGQAGRIGILERFSICVLVTFAVLRFSFSVGPQLNQIGGSKHRGQTGTAASTRRTTSRTNHLPCWHRHRGGLRGREAHRGGDQSRCSRPASTARRRPPPPRRPTLPSERVAYSSLFTEPVFPLCSLLPTMRNFCLALVCSELDLYHAVAPPHLQRMPAHRRHHATASPLRSHLVARAAAPSA